MVGVAGEGVVRIKASSQFLPASGTGVSADTLLGNQLTARFQLPVSLYCCFTVCTVSYLVTVTALLAMVTALNSVHINRNDITHA